MSLKISVIIGRIIFYTLLLLVFVAATPYGIVSPWRGAVETLLTCVILVLGCLWMIEGMLSGRLFWRSHLLLLPLLALAAFTYFQTLNLGVEVGASGLNLPLWQSISFDPYETRIMAWRFLAYAVMLGLLLRQAATRGRLRVLIILVIGIGIASALYALIRQTTQHSSGEFLFPYVQMDVGGDGQFVNRNHFALLMEMALGLLLGLLASGRERALIYLAAAVPIWTALVLSNSRGGVISMISQMLLTALMFTAVRGDWKGKSDSGEREVWYGSIGRSWAFRLGGGLILLTVILVSVVWVGGEQLAGRFETISHEVGVEATDSREGARRADIWRATFRMIKEHPLVGVGFGGYWIAIAQYHNASGRMAPQQAHNDYLELLASGGIIALLITLCFLFLFAKFTSKQLRSMDKFRRAACFGSLIGLFGVAVHSLVDFGLHIPINALVCLVLIAIATVSVRADLNDDHVSDNVSQHI